MGRDKASLRLAGDRQPRHVSPEGGPTLAQRTAGLLAAACSPALELGPGWSGLPVVPEPRPGMGPPAAIAAGWEALTSTGWGGPVIVVATDLPNLTGSMLAWLAGRPGDRSVVPVAGGRVQPLCARYSPADLERACRLVAGGRRSMRALLEDTRPELAPEYEWAGAAGGVEVLADVDTGEDLRRLMGR